MIYRLLEKQLGETVTCSELIQTLRNYKFKHLYGAGYLPTYTRTTITDQLHQAFGFQTDFEIISEKNMKKIFKKPNLDKKYAFFKREKELRKAVISAFRGSLFSKNCQRWEYTTFIDIFQAFYEFSLISCSDHVQIACKNSYFYS